MSEAVVVGVWQTFALLIGLVLGSFCNLCIDRLPHDRSIIPRSHCDSCGHVIRPVDLVPILSWIWLRGKCRDCGAAIGAHVPVGELLVGLLSVLLWRRFVPSVNDIDTAHVAAWVVFLTFACLLVVATYVDVRHRIIPDETSIYAAPLGVAGAAVLAWLGYDGWLAIGWRSSIYGALFGGSMLGSMAIAFRAIKGQDSLGWGDVKLLLMIGAFVGPIPGVFVVLLLGSITSGFIGIFVQLVFKVRWLPFGPALAGAALLFVLYGEEIVGTLFPGMLIWLSPPALSSMR